MDSVRWTVVLVAGSMALGMADGIAGRMGGQMGVKMGESWTGCCTESVMSGFGSQGLVAGVPQKDGSSICLATQVADCLPLLASRAGQDHHPSGLKDLWPLAL
jgi:hypothetical protein